MPDVFDLYFKWLGKAQEPSDFRSVTEQGALLQHAINEKCQDFAQCCAKMSLAAAWRCDSPDLSRRITLLILDVQQMPSK
ncbi:MAG: hypothetical protein K8T91_23650 [Planctomycetes bacterium]|nr:hypothetical protein [Planctomycetota bacterium]